jgi:hypothetical protein
MKSANVLSCGLSLEVPVYFSAKSYPPVFHLDLNRVSRNRNIPL